MSLGGGLIFLALGPVGKLFKDDTGPEKILRIKGVVYELGFRLILVRMGTVRNLFKEDNGTECSLGVKGVVYEPGG